MESLRDKRRLQIIKSAIEIFGTEGFHKGTMEEIAQGAGLGKGTVYEYFKSKKELFMEVVIFLLKDFMGRLDEIRQKDIGIREKLAIMMDESSSFINENYSLIKETVFNNQHISEKFKKESEILHNEIFLIVEGIVEEGMEIGEIDRSLNKETLTFILLNTILGMVEPRKQYGDKYILDSDYIVEILFKGMGL